MAILRWFHGAVRPGRDRAGPGIAAAKRSVHIRPVAVFRSVVSFIAFARSAGGNASGNHAGRLFSAPGHFGC